MCLEAVNVSAARRSQGWLRRRCGWAILDEETFAFDEELVVIQVYDQARKRGVQVGWTVVAINGVEAKTGHDIRKLLARAHCTSSTIEVTFTAADIESSSPLDNDSKSSSKHNVL